jgi:predicted ferric reductase
MKGLWAVYIVLLLGLTLRYRLLLPILRWRHPWEVVRNEAERGHVRTLTIRPVGHPGFFFEAGQFAWLLTGHTPFSWAQHPISFSSSAEIPSNNEISFSIKALGNWSGGVVPSLAPGKRLWLDGPHGVFSLDRAQGSSYVLIGGGIGVSPLLSMCRTLADRGDVRPVTFFYGAPRWEDVSFREALETLKTRMNLTLIYVLEEAPPQKNFHLHDWLHETRHCKYI